MVILPASEPTGKLEIDIFNVSFRINEEECTEKAAAGRGSSNKNRDRESVQILMGHRSSDGKGCTCRLAGLGV